MLDGLQYKYTSHPSPQPPTRSTIQPCHVMRVNSSSTASIQNLMMAS